MEVYTIGYSAFSIEKFISVLQSKNIKCLIDARSTPYSQYFQDYNKEQLEKKLKIIKNFFKKYKWICIGITVKSLARDKTI